MEREQQSAAPEAAAPATVPGAATPVKAAGARLIAVQRTAGNHAAMALIQRTKPGDPPTKPAEPGTTTGGTSGGTTSSTPATPAPPTPATPITTKPDDAAAIASPADYVRKEAGSSWDEVRKKYKTGLLTFVPGGDDGKGNFPTSTAGGGMNALLAYRIRATVQMTEDAKGGHVSPLQGVVPAVVKKQAQSRAEQAEAAKKAGVKKELPPSAPLKWNYGAGSGTATSDIDVNLSGDETEYAVAEFNDVFRSTWKKESGTVFDLNVYGRDYLPETGAKSLAVAKGKVDKAKKDSGTAGPGAIPRGSGWKGQNVTWESSFDAGSSAEADHEVDQEVMSLVKTRKDMSAVDWAKYKAIQLEAYGDDGKARGLKDLVFTMVEYRYEGREEAIKAKAAELADAAKKAAERKNEAAPKKPETKEEQKEERLRAENAIYEEKLKEVAQLRSQLVVAKAKLDEGLATAKEVEELSLKLQKAIHTSSMYANEAYITGAAVLHVVGNLQVLEGSEDIQIGLSAQDYLASCNEQLGFIFDDFEREGGDVDKGLLKAGKYISRLGHAASKVEGMATKAQAAKSQAYVPLASPSAAEVKGYGDQLMKIKDKPPDEQIPAVRVANVGGWKLSGKSIDVVKTAIQTFAAKVQTLKSKV